MTIPDLVREAKACFEAGAEALHAHLRDSEQRHILDAGLYRELLTELSAAVPKLLVQVTTEAVGRYSAAEQRALVRDLLPGHVSIALREMSDGEDDARLRAFYHWAHEAGIGVQHILYSPRDLVEMAGFLARDVIPEEDLEVLFVLGSYAGTRDSQPDDLFGFLEARTGPLVDAAFAVCAFGRLETACLVQAVGQGGKARIGFENNLLNADGSFARDNAERVEDLVRALRATPAAV